MAERRGKGRESRLGTRQRIIAAAREVFGRLGYRATTTRAIAARVGIDISTLAHHMGSKAQIYRAVLESIYEEHVRMLEEAVGRLEGMELEEAVDEIVGRTMEYLFRHPEVPRLLLFATVGLDVGKGGEAKSHYVPRFLDRVRRQAERLWASTVADKDKFEILCMAMVNLMATFTGGAPFQAASLGMNADGEKYRRLATDAVKTLFLPLARNSPRLPSDAAR